MKWWRRWRRALRAGWRHGLFQARMDKLGFEVGYSTHIATKSLLDEVRDNGTFEEKQRLASHIGQDAASSMRRATLRRLGVPDEDRNKVPGVPA